MRPNTPGMRSHRSQIAGVVMADATKPGFPLTYVSPGFEEMTGYSVADVLGKSCALLQGPETDPRSIAVLREALRDGREAYATMLNYRADGTPVGAAGAEARSPSPGGALEAEGGEELPTIMRARGSSLGARARPKGRECT